MPYIITGVTALVSGLSANRTAKKNTERTNRANMQMAEYQYSKDQEMWNKANEYNSPQQQMKRLEVAQLNPNLVYGGGNVTGNSSAQLPKFQAPRMEYNYQSGVPAALDTINQFQDLRIKQEQKDNIVANRKVAEANLAKIRLANTFAEGTLTERTAGEKFKTLSLGWKQELDDMKKQSFQQMFPFQVEFQKARNRQLDQSTMKMFEEAARIKNATEFDKLKMDWYETQIMSNMGAQLFRTMGGIKSMFKGSRIGTYKPIGRAADRAFEETTRRMRQFGR